jgi:calcineurin-like phosphoesterase family protein
MDKRYIADPHFQHGRIIELCERPFGGVAHMDRVLLGNLRDAEGEGASIHILGDLSFSFEDFIQEYGWLDHPERHALVLGNHDKERDRLAWELAFGTVIGTKATWREHYLIVEDELDGRPVRVMLSHEAQRNLRGADFNLYGHHHNNMVRNPERYPRSEWGWLQDSRRHFIVSAEMVDYRPRTLAELVALRDAVG